MADIKSIWSCLMTKPITVACDNSSEWASQMSEVYSSWYFQVYSEQKMLSSYFVLMKNVVVGSSGKQTLRWNWKCKRFIEITKGRRLWVWYLWKAMGRKEVGVGAEPHISGWLWEAAAGPVGARGKAPCRGAHCGQKWPGPGALLCSVITWELPGGAWPQFRCCLRSRGDAAGDSFNCLLGSWYASFSYSEVYWHTSKAAIGKTFKDWIYDLKIKYWNKTVLGMWTVISPWDINEY